jgi:hypothetical protein
MAQAKLSARYKTSCWSLQPTPPGMRRLLKGTGAFGIPKLQTIPQF